MGADLSDLQADFDQTEEEKAQNPTEMEPFDTTLCHDCCGTVLCLEWFWPILTAFVSIIIFTAIFTAIFMDVEGWDMLISSYFVVTTITSIAYGDFSPVSDAGKTWSIILIYSSSIWLFGLFQYIIFSCVNGCSNLDSITKCCCCCKCKNGRCSKFLRKCGSSNYGDEHSWSILSKIDEFAEDNKYFEKLKNQLNIEMVASFDLDLDGLHKVYQYQEKETGPIIEILQTIYNSPYEIANPLSEEAEFGYLKSFHEQICSDKLCDINSFVIFLLVTIIYVCWFIFWISIFCEQTYGDDKFNFLDTIYFGVVTISSVGYGDFSPYNNVFWGDDIVKTIIWSSTLGVIISLIWINLIVLMCSNAYYWCCFRLCCDGTNDKFLCDNCTCFLRKKICNCCVTLYDERLKIKTDNVLFWLQLISKKKVNPNVLPKYHFYINQNNEEINQNDEEIYMPPFLSATQHNSIQINGYLENVPSNSAGNNSNNGSNISINIDDTGGNNSNNRSNNGSSSGDSNNEPQNNADQLQQDRALVDIVPNSVCLIL